MGAEASVIEIDVATVPSIPGCTVKIAPSSVIARSIRYAAFKEEEARLSSWAEKQKEEKEKEENKEKEKEKSKPVKKERRGREEEEQDEYREGEGEEDEELRETKKQKTKEKPPADPEGYRFRKYGKKMIGNEARHYFRCTFPCCEVKRHVTFHNGVPEIVVLGEHGHPPPTVTRMRILPPSAPVRVVMGPAPAMPPPPPPPRMMGAIPRAALPPTNSGGATSVSSQAELRAALDAQQQGPLLLLLPPSVDHQRDDFSWISVASDKYQCTVVGCGASKTTSKAGEKVLVEYSGPHSHKRPLLLGRYDAPPKRLSAGNKGSLDDVYMLLAAAEEA